MELKYKPDWDIVKKRLNALWDREILDRCCVAVTAPLDKNKPYIEDVPTDPDELKAYYLDVEWILKRNEERMEKTYFGGDAFPCIFPYFGTGGLSVIRSHLLAGYNLDSGGYEGVCGI